MAVLKEAKQEIDPKLLEMASRNRGGRGGFDRASNRRYGSFQKGSFGGRSGGGGGGGGGRSWGGSGGSGGAGRTNNYTGNFNRSDNNTRKTFD